MVKGAKSRLSSRGRTGRTNSIARNWEVGYGDRSSSSAGEGGRELYDGLRYAGYGHRASSGDGQEILAWAIPQFLEVDSASSIDSQSTYLYIGP